MLNVDTKIKITKEVMNAPDLTGRFSEEDLASIGNHVFEGYIRDVQSRSSWEARTEAAMDLAMQVQKDKNFPWPGCSNVAFPLITIATLQFHSRAYPAIVPNREIVRYRVSNPDPQGAEFIRAQKIGAHMSYQVMEEDHSWEEQHDRLLINVPIVGCAFKKSYYSGSKMHNLSDLVLAQDLVMDYYAKSVEECARKTHVYPMFRNEVHEKSLMGTFRDVTEEAWFTQYSAPHHDKADTHSDRRHGTNQPQADSDTPFILLEQHVGLDLDGDGYKEPYIVTIERESKKVLRVVAGFDRWEDVQFTTDGRIIKIIPTQYFTKYGFVPSPDGGVYDIGFGALLGPLNESVNSLVNQLIDAGTMSTTAGGFLGRGAKIRSGTATFAPLEWKRVDSTGDDLKKSIFPLPVREPSMVLFQLLGMLITYTNRISGATETLAGENPGQNTPASTNDSMVEQGMKIYAAIFKRIWRCQREEFKKLYRLNATYLPDESRFGDSGIVIRREDYKADENRITPVADPSAMSRQQRIQQAMALKQSAVSTPGYDIPAVERHLLRAMEVDGWETLYLGPDKTPPIKNPRVQVEEMKLRAKQMQMKADTQMFVADLMEQRRLNTAKILQLEAQAAKLAAEAGGVQAGHEIAAFEAALGALKSHDEAMRHRIELMLKSMEIDNAGEQAKRDGAGIQ